MKDFLQWLYTLDPYHDPVERRRAITIYTFVSLSLAGNLFYLLLFLAVNPASLADNNNLSLPIITGINLISFGLVRRGQRNWAAWLVLGVVMMTAALLSFGRPERDYEYVTAFIMLLTIILSPLMISPQGVIWVTAFNILGLAFNAINGISLEGLSLASEYNFILLSGFTSMAGVISWLSGQSFESLSKVAQLEKTQQDLLLQKVTTAVAKQVTTQLDLEALLRDSVDTIRDQIPQIYHAQVFLTDPQQKLAILRASTGEVGQALLAKKHRLEVGSQSVIGQVTGKNELVLISDTAKHEGPHKVNELLKDTRTELAVPLRGRQGVIGALDVQSLEPDAFDAEDIETLQSLADQIAIALENARLYQAAQAETERAKAMAQASQMISQFSTDFDKGLARLFETITTPGEYTHWWFGLMQADGQTLRCVTSHKTLSTAQLIPFEMNIQRDRNTITDAFRLKRSLVVNQLENSANFRELNSVVFDMYGKHIASPILNRDSREVLGVLLVGRDLKAADLEARDLELVNTLSSQVSILVQNRQLFLQLEQEQKRLQAVLGAMPVSVVVIDPQQNILLSNEQALNILGPGAKTGSNMSQAYPFYRTGTDELYPYNDLPRNAALRDKQVASVEDISIKQPDGSQIDLLSRAAPLLNDRGEVTSVVAVYQDISELRELERALQESLSETTKLYEASRAISHSNDLAGITESVINQMLMLAPDAVYMTMRNSNASPPNDNIQLILSWPHEKPQAIEDIGLPSSLLLPDQRFGTTNLTFATRNLYQLAGLRRDEVEQLQAQGVKSIAVMPLETRGETFGAIIAIFHEERLFAPEERRFLLTLADQTSVALDAVMLFQSTQETLRSISRMYQASRAIAGQSDIDEALQIIREQVMLLEPDRVDISLARDQDGQGMLVSVMDWSSDDDYTPLSLLGDQDNLFDFLSYDDIFIDDLAKAQDHILLSVYADLPYQAIASLPFRAAGQPTGRLTIAFRRKRAFSTDEKQFLQMIADSTAYVIENDILFKQTQDSLEETGILYQAIRAFANAEDKEGILQAIIDYAADPAVDKALLCLLLTEDWYSPNALMEVVVSWVRGDSVDLTGMRFTSEQFPSWEQIATTEILWVDDVMTTPTLDDTARMGYRALDVGSFAIVPLIMSNKPIGAILLGSSEPRLHREREIRIYQSLADQAAITMENIRLFAESERRARQLGTSAQVSRAASSILTVDTLLPQIVDLIKEAFGYDHVQVFLLNKEGDKAMLHASTGEAGQQLLAIHHYLEVGSRSVIGQVTATGKPSIALDTADARVTHKPNPYLPNTRSEMALPLIANDRILGALDVQSNQPGAFTDNDVRVLTILSDQLAVAIQNASLFELSRRRNEEMSFLFEVASQATTLGEIDKTLQAVAHLILQQTGASLVAIYLHDEAAAALQLNAITLADPLPMGEILQRTELSSDDALAQVASNRLPIIISDYGYSDYYSTRPPQIQSGIYVPMVTGDRLIGVLSVESMELNDFDDSTLNLLQTLSSSLAAVIQSKQLLEEIQTANERLREIDKLKTNFLAAMSHELRTPLNSIIGFSRVILKGIDGPVTETQKQDLQTIHDSGKHLLGLVNDILDQAKIESNKMELARAYFDLRPVINGVMASAVGLTKEKPIQLLKEVQDDLPNAFGDEFRTRQILLNLVSNAAKFTEEGSITTSVYVVEKEGIKYLKASVTDTGIGIRPEDFDKMFESFQQVDNSTTRAAEGTGLGLPLARSLARLQGGDVEVESEYGVGSTFSVLIPTQPTAKQLADMAAKEQGGPDEPSPAPSNGNTPPAPKSILILDDNVDMMNFYRRHLSKEGYTIIGVTTLKDAYDKLATVNPAAILLNVDMDNGQGWAYMADLKQLPLPRPIPIIVNSLSSDPGQSQEQGAAFHLARPFEPEVLLEALGKIG